jgi:predicted phage tail protein
MEKEIRLYGPLAKFVGQRKFLAEISSAGEAIRMLLANFPGLERHMADHNYKVIVDNYEADLDEIHYPASQTIKIVPVLGGAGGPVGKIFTGVALVAAAIVLGPAVGGFMGLGAGLATGGAGIIGGVAATAIGAIGASLILGGVAQLLSPTPQIGGLGPVSAGRATTTERTEQDPQESYSFSGIQNTSRQGTAVPVVYGETIVGSVVISAGIDVDTI